MWEKEKMQTINQDLFDLAMSEQARPLMKAVQDHIEQNIVPITEEFFALDNEKEDRWSWHPRQLELLDGAKDKAKKSGLWNFFLPESEYGTSLTNLDYAYIAAELGKHALASESLNCSAPDTGNMEVLERVGTPAQQEKWLKPLLHFLFLLFPVLGTLQMKQWLKWSLIPIKLHLQPLPIL